MNTQDPELRMQERTSAHEDRIQYVEELAPPDVYPEGDAWISLTDAARVTRTSEAMARRWVTSGRLKVKKEAVGIPPRTRLVRLSDVAAIRPIVDPTAAITDEVRKLDLPSIPRQQVQIMEDHQRLLALIDALTQRGEHEASELRAQVRRDLDALDAQVQSSYETLATQGAQQFVALRDSVTEQLVRTDATIEEQRTGLERLATALDEYHQQLTQAHQELVDRVNMQDQGQATRLHEALVRLDAEDQKQGERLDGLEMQRRDLVAQMETLERDQARDLAQVTQQLEALDPKLVQMETNARNALAPVQARVNDQEQHIDGLTQDLRQEREARQALSTTLEAQQEQLDALRSMVEKLTKQKKATR